jgi:mono/diheme cytochrome c family protein
VVFETHCQVCHQAGGVGVAGQFPRVAGRAGVIAATPEGRQFLSALVLNGMSGTVKVDGQKIIGVMPAFDSLTDAEAASVLTYISTLGAGKANVAPFRAAEIATARTLGKQTPTDMVKRRNQLAADKIIP